MARLFHVKKESKNDQRSIYGSTSPHYRNSDRPCTSPLSIGDADKAEDALDVCSVKLKEIYRARCATMGIDLTQLGDHWQ